MDHRELISSLSREQRSALNAKSNRIGLVHLFIHAGAIALTGTLIATQVPLWVLLLPVQGILIIFLFTLLHEAIHRTPFRSVWLNDAVAQVCGFLVLVPAQWFRYFHFAHHRHTQDPENDPELATPKPETRKDYIIHVSGIPVWWSAIKSILLHALGKCDASYVPKSARKTVVLEARISLALYMVLAGASFWQASTLLLAVWMVPILLGQPFLRLYLLAEHGRCPLVANMLENSRTTFTNRLVRLLAWNMPYHAEHHAWPTVPFHQLPELHELTKAHLKTTEDGYGRFNRKYVADLDVE